MTSLAEGVAARVTYKPYATGVITDDTQAVSATDPGATGGQLLRRVSSSLTLGKDSYASQEIRTDRQNVDFRHGVKRVSGSISGEYSPLTYADLFQAATRGTWAAAIAKSNTELTSAAASSVTSDFTFAGGNPVTEGFRVGMAIRFTNLSEALNNSKNFVITAFSGASNRVVAVYPAPTTMAADVAFNVVSVGKTLAIPSSSHVDRKFAFEHWYEDIDFAKLFCECRVAGFNVQLPATGMATVDFPVMGRDMEVYTAGAAPFFSGTPAAETGTGIFQAVNGLLMVGGSRVGVVTGLNISLNLNPSSEAVVGQNFVPEIHLARANVTGQLQAFLKDATLINNFKNEDEVSLLAYLTTSVAAAAAANVIYLPRIKFTGDDNPLQGEGGQSISMPFQALRSTTAPATAGTPDTTLQIADTEVV